MLSRSWQTAALLYQKELFTIFTAKAFWNSRHSREFSLYKKAGPSGVFPPRKEPAGKVQQLQSRIRSITSLSVSRSCVVRSSRLFRIFLSAQALEELLLLLQLFEQRAIEVPPLASIALHTMWRAYGSSFCRGGIMPRRAGACPPRAPRRKTPPQTQARPEYPQRRAKASRG